MSLPSDGPETDPHISSEETLPEVTPPSAGFILQLFFIPGVIVFVIVLVWMLFSWLAHMGNDPKSYIDTIRQNRPNSWQVAHDFVIELQRKPDLQKDAELARAWAELVAESLDRPLPKKSPQTEGDEIRRKRDARSEEVERRAFLCKALGEFRVDAGLPVLVRAAGPHQDDDEARIRFTALEAIAVLAHNLRQIDKLDREAVLPTLLAATDDDERIIKVAGAYGLGVVGGDLANERLEQMAASAHDPDVHYNVATALARNGNAACLDLLLEMLDPEEDRGLDREKKDSEKRAKRIHILQNGLAATRQLVKANETVDVGPLVEAVENLVRVDFSPPVTAQAKVTLALLKQRNL